MDCEFRGQFNTPKQAQVWCMKILAELPIYRRGNIQWLRLKAGGMPDIGFERIEIDGAVAFIWPAKIIYEPIESSSAPSWPNCFCLTDCR